MVQGYYEQRWAGTNHYNISAGGSPNGRGFNITSTTDPLGTMDNVLNKHTSAEKMMELLGGILTDTIGWISPNWLVTPLGLHGM